MFETFQRLESGPLGVDFISGKKILALGHQLCTTKRKRERESERVRERASGGQKIERKNCVLCLVTNLCLPDRISEAHGLGWEKNCPILHQRGQPYARQRGQTGLLFLRRPTGGL